MDHCFVTAHLQAELVDETAAISESNLAAPEDGRTPTESFRLSLAVAIQLVLGSTANLAVPCGNLPHGREWRSGTPNGSLGSRHSVGLVARQLEFGHLNVRFFGVPCDSTAFAPGIPSR
jgi:hypothetical protein